MKKNIIVIVTAILFAISIPRIFAYNVADNEQNVQVINKASLKSEAKFALDETVKGIPGEIIPISKMNEIDAKDSTDKLVFKITYSVDDVEFIKNISLIDESSLIKDPNSTDKSVTYYGVVNAKEVKNLGELVAEFTVPREATNDYVVTVDYTASQQIAEAIEDNLGVKPVDAYASLMN